MLIAFLRSQSLAREKTNIFSSFPGSRLGTPPPSGLLPLQLFPGLQTNSSMLAHTTVAGATGTCVPRQEPGNKENRLSQTNLLARRETQGRLSIYSTGQIQGLQAIADRLGLECAVRDIEL